MKNNLKNRRVIGVGIILISLTLYVLVSSDFHEPTHPIETYESELTVEESYVGIE